MTVIRSVEELRHCGGLRADEQDSVLGVPAGVSAACGGQSVVREGGSGSECSVCEVAGVVSGEKTD